MDKVKWVDIPGYEGLYQASKEGRIKKCPTIINGKLQKEKYCSLMQDSTGYHRVSITKYGDTKFIHVHVLMAMTFLNHICNGHKMVIDHIDNVKLNNKLSNLQRISHAENLRKDRKNKIGITGVYRSGKKYVSRISINKECLYLGTFNTKEEAREAYLNQVYISENQQVKK